MALIGVVGALVGSGCAGGGARAPVAAGGAANPDLDSEADPEGQLGVLTWNIWHGGREDGAEVGPARVAGVIRASGADVVALQETYGSGERLAAELGFALHARGTNVSILSRYPILEDISVFEEFKAVGAIIAVPGSGAGPSRVAVYSIWLPYAAEIWEEGTRPRDDAAAMVAACAPSAEDIAAILDGIDRRLSGPAYAGVPVVIAGDFNSMSHLDYAEAHRDQYGLAIDWPTSLTMAERGYRDAYREVRPAVVRDCDRTWTPRFPQQEQDRIDFIYLRGAEATPTGAAVIDSYPEGFPSDHAAVLATVRLHPATERTMPASPPTSIRATTYNIRHGRGMDGRVDLARTAATLRRLVPDIVGLQEVDQGVDRSDGTNQVVELAALMADEAGHGFHAAFGAFMDLGGGRYGMGMLSRYPIVRTWSVPLPVGNEPRVALAAEIRLPDGGLLTVVNVHFDWVEDDRHRFAQAEALAAALGSLETPFLLLGDFNDQPGSRTIELFRAVAREVPKAGEGMARRTFSSTEPTIEIDYLFVSPPGANGGWRARRPAEVIDERIASDHRPVVAELEWIAGSP
jgi:endonuclease/exonuclease/phosphatase family metal-dependent hydrolase